MGNRTDRGSYGKTRRKENSAYGIPILMGITSWHDCSMGNSWNRFHVWNQFWGPFLEWAWNRFLTWKRPSSDVEPLLFQRLMVNVVEAHGNSIIKDLKAKVVFVTEEPETIFPSNTEGSA
jgi:hypothetical protein